jgi:hypothetical protein
MGGLVGDGVGGGVVFEWVVDISLKTPMNWACTT